MWFQIFRWHNYSTLEISNCVKSKEAVMSLIRAQISGVKNLMYWCGERVMTNLKQRGSERDEHIRVKVNLDIFFLSGNDVEMTLVWSNAQ